MDLSFFSDKKIASAFSRAIAEFPPSRSCNTVYTFRGKKYKRLEAISAYIGYHTGSTWNINKCRMDVFRFNKANPGHPLGKIKPYWNDRLRQLLIKAKNQTGKVPQSSPKTSGYKTIELFLTFLEPDDEVATPNMVQEYWKHHVVKSSGARKPRSRAAPKPKAKKAPMMVEEDSESDVGSDHTETETDSESEDEIEAVDGEYPSKSGAKTSARRSTRNRVQLQGYFDDDDDEEVGSDLDIETEEEQEESYETEIRTWRALYVTESEKSQRVYVSLETEEGRPKDNVLSVSTSNGDKLLSTNRPGITSDNIKSSPEGRTVALSIGDASCLLIFIDNQRSEEFYKCFTTAFDKTSPIEPNTAPKLITQLVGRCSSPLVPSFNVANEQKENSQSNTQSSLLQSPQSLATISSLKRPSPFMDDEDDADDAASQETVKEIVLSQDSCQRRSNYDVQIVKNPEYPLAAQADDYDMEQNDHDGDNEPEHPSHKIIAGYVDFMKRLPPHLKEHFRPAVVKAIKAEQNKVAAEVPSDTARKLAGYSWAYQNSPSFRAYVDVLSTAANNLYNSDKDFATAVDVAKAQMFPLSQF